MVVHSHSIRIVKDIRRYLESFKSSFDPMAQISSVASYAKQVRYNKMILCPLIAIFKTL